MPPNFLANLRSKSIHTIGARDIVNKKNIKDSFNLGTVIQQETA